MNRKISAEMIRARGLLRMGQSAAEAARATGLSKGAISKDPDCREIIDEYKGKQFRLVAEMVARGVTVKGACAEYNVVPNSYYVWKARNAAKNTQSA